MRRVWFLQVLGGDHHFESLATPQEAPVFKHLPAAGMESPEAAFTRLVRSPRDLDEAVVEWKVVAKRVLPALCVFPIKRKPVHDELVNFAEREHLLRATLNGHSGERNIRIRRLLVAVRVSSRTRHFPEWSIRFLELSDEYLQNSPEFVENRTLIRSEKSNILINTGASADTHLISILVKSFEQTLQCFFVLFQEFVNCCPG